MLFINTIETHIARSVFIHRVVAQRNTKHELTRYENNAKYEAMGAADP